MDLQPAAAPACRPVSEAARSIRSASRRLPSGRPAGRMQLACLGLWFAGALAHAAAPLPCEPATPAVSVPGHACPPTPSAGPAPAPAPTPPAAGDIVQPGAAPHWRHWRGVLFRIVAPASGGRAAPVSFMLGTLHFGTPQQFGLDTDRLRAALRDTTLLIDEADAVGGPLPAALAAHRTLPPSTPLDALIGGASFATLAQLLPEMPAERLRRMKPWVALALLESRGEPAGEQTLDRQVLHWAGEAGMPVLHLETLAEQLRALDCVPAGEHAQVLRQRLATPWLFEEQAQRVLEYYRAGDLPAWLDDVDAMTGLDAAASAVEQRARACLIEARNARWLAQLDPILRAASAFVAVGALHLTGADGLLASLRQRGFSIAALPL